MSKLKKSITLSDAKPGDIVGPSKPQVMSRCPHCRTVNPVLESWPAGESSDAVQVMFVLACCKLIVGAQLVAKNAAMGEAAGEPVKVM